MPEYSGLNWRYNPSLVYPTKTTNSGTTGVGDASSTNSATTAQTPTGGTGSSGEEKAEVKSEESPAGATPSANLTTLKKALADAEERAEEATRRREEAQNNREAAERKLKDSLGREKAAAGKQRDAEGRLAKAEEKLEAFGLIHKANTEALRKRGDLQRIVETLSKEKEQLMDDAKTASKRIADLDSSVKTSMAEKKESEAEINKLKSRLDDKERELKDLNTKLQNRTSHEPEVEHGKLPLMPKLLRLCRSIFPTTDDVSSNDPAVFSTKRLWPNGQVITYRFVDGHINQHIKVTRVIPEWSRYANIAFKLVSGDALLVISFKNDWECWSHIGTDARTTTANPSYTMALGPLSADTSSATRGDRALILHQFGHALGLVHEHMCPAETDIKSLKQNVFFEHLSFRKLDLLVGKYLSVYANSSVTNYASPDLSSIMIFSMPGELNEGNIDVEPNMALSPMDKAFMVINYPRARVHSQASEWTLRHALLIANVDDHTSRTITEEHDLAKRRTLFAKFLLETRQRGATKFADPAPKIVEDFSLPPVRHALHTFFTASNTNLKAKEILVDPDLKEELIVMLGRLATHRVIRTVVQRGKVGCAQPEVLDRPGAEPSFVSSLLSVALMFYGAAKHQDLSRSCDVKSGVPKEVDALITWYAQLAQHTTFRAAMERVLEEKAPPTEALPDVSDLVARLAKRPALLQAVRLALRQYV